MNWSIVQPRARVARILTVAALVAMVAVCATALVLSGPAAAARHSTPAETVLTLRTSGDHDTLWLLSSSEGTATAAGTLPGVAEWAAASPDESTVAYLPELGKPFVWIGYGPSAPKTISLEAAGIKTVTGFTWTSETQLLVAGSKKAQDFSGYNDHLYTVDVTTGAVAAFRGLSGTEPSASPDTGKVVYVHFKKLDNGGAKNDHTPKYRESLMLTTLTGSGAGSELDSQEYRPVAAYRAYAAPQIAAGGEWVAYGQTGSDVSVTYYVCYLGDGYIMPWLIMPQATPMAVEWAPASPLLALAGAAAGPDVSNAAVYVADVAGGRMGRTSRDLFSQASVTWVMDMDWSLAGRIVADGLDKNANTGDSNELHVMMLDSSDLSKATDLGAGHLSVWVK